MKCKFIKQNGQQCEAKAIKDSDYCFFHSDKKQRKLASQKGGQNRIAKQKEPLEVIELEKAEDIKKLLAKVINEVRSGQTDVKVAHCIATLSNYFLKAVEVSDIQNRVEKVERVILEKKTIY